MNFADKVIKRVNIDRTQFRCANIVYEEGIMLAKTTNGVFPIHNWDCLENVNVVYSLPKNDAYKAWTAKNCSTLTRNNPHVHSISRFWSKYKPGDRIVGEVKNGIFYESNISRDTKTN